MPDFSFQITPEENAAYVADLKAVVQDAPELWAAFLRESAVLTAAYGYLRTPEAAQEWPSAVSRLIDAQDRTRAAAAAFDERAREIAQVHERHLYAELGCADALRAAGYPEGEAWHVVEAYQYGGRAYSSGWDVHPLEAQVRRLIEDQDAHVAKVGRLSGMTG
ncbi:hypothetical protein [Streptomyces sp. NPDC006368]|uniref:hypothetical protein n=1 Tax=Streptomyces sp. NPDC006368 TaxID=3156760 RepID=UPI0033AA9607